MEEKKEDQRKYKRKKIIEKYEIENEPEDIKSLWITYSKLKQYDVNEDLKDDIQKLV